MTDRIDEAPVIRDDETLNALVGRCPQTLPILHGLGLDLCCGGALTLREAAAAHGLDLPRVLAQLEQAASTQAA